MVADAGDDFKRGESLRIRRREARNVLSVGMLILTSVDVEGGPFGEAAAEEFARILNLRLARGFAGHGTVMTGHLFAGILGDAENEETEIH